MIRCLPQSFLAMGLIAALAAMVACEQSGSSNDLIPAEPETAIGKVCSRAYGGMDGNRTKQLQALTEEQKKSVTPLPTKAEFVKMCTALDDEALARCLDPNWYGVNSTDCAAGFEKLPKDQVASIMGMLTGKPAEPAKTEERDKAPEGETPAAE